MQKIISGGLVVAMACGVASCKPAPVAAWVAFEAMPEATICMTHPPFTGRVTGRKCGR